MTLSSLSLPANIFSAGKSRLSFSLYPSLPPSLPSVILSPPFCSYTSYFTTVSSITPADPLLSRSARIRSPKIIRNRFETRPFESWRSWRGWGIDRGSARRGEAKEKVQRFLLLPLLSSTPPRRVFFSWTPLDGVDLFNCFIISAARHDATRRRPLLKPPPTSSLSFIVFFARAISRQ